MSRTFSFGLSALLVAFSWTPARAQLEVLDSAGTRAPAKKAEILFAMRVTKAAALPLDRTSRLLQPAGKPHPLAKDPLAGKALRGEGARVDLAGLEVQRLAFDSSAEAKVAAVLMGQGARVDPRQPLCVTSVSGTKASPEILARVESLATGGELPADLAKTLGLAERKRSALSRALRIPRATLGFEGVEVRLKGLAVLRLRFTSEKSARSFLEGMIGAVAVRQVMDQVGAELVLLAGPALSNLALGRKALAAAWKAGKAPQGKRGTIGVWIGKRDAERERASAVFCAANAALYQEAAEFIRGCRKGAKESAEAGGIQWRFTDPQTRNHVLFRVKPLGLGGESAAATRYGGVLATPAGILHVNTPSRERCDKERRYLLELMGAVGQSLPQRSKERVRLLEAE